MAKKNIKIGDNEYNNIDKIKVNIVGGGKAEYVETSDSNATAANIKDGVTAYVNGIKVTGSAKIGGGAPILQDGVEYPLGAQSYDAIANSSIGKEYIRMEQVGESSAFLSYLLDNENQFAGTAVTLDFCGDKYIMANNYSIAILPDGSTTREASNIPYIEGIYGYYRGNTSHGLMIQGKNQTIVPIRDGDYDHYYTVINGRPDAVISEGSYIDPDSQEEVWCNYDNGYYYTKNGYLYMPDGTSYQINAINLNITDQLIRHSFGSNPYGRLNNSIVCSNVDSNYSLIYAYYNDGCFQGSSLHNLKVNVDA